MSDSAVDGMTLQALAQKWSKNKEMAASKLLVCGFAIGSFATGGFATGEFAEREFARRDSARSRLV